MQCSGRKELPESEVFIRSGSGLTNSPGVMKQISDYKTDTNINLHFFPKIRHYINANHMQNTAKISIICSRNHLQTSEASQNNDINNIILVAQS